LSHFGEQEFIKKIHKFLLQLDETAIQASLYMLMLLSDDETESSSTPSATEDIKVLIQGAAAGVSSVSSSPMKKRKARESTLKNSFFYI